MTISARDRIILIPPHVPQFEEVIERLIPVAKGPMRD
jgi:hypothetical protein